MKKPGWKRSVLKFVVKVSRGGGWTKRSVVSKEGEVFCGGEGIFSVEGKGGRILRAFSLFINITFLYRRRAFRLLVGKWVGWKGV